MYITPKYTDIMNLRSNDSELSAALAKAKDIDNISKNLSEKMRSFQKENLDRLERLLPLKFDDLRFVNDLQGVGERNGLKIQGITITDAPTNTSGNQPQAGVPGEPKTANKGYAAHKFSFTVSASYKTFVIFLKDLERSLQFTDMNSISLSTSGGMSPQGQGGKQASSDTYNYQVEFTTYSLK